MFCCHCGKEINEAKVESKKVDNQVIETNGDINIQYVCPRCGHLIHDNLDEGQVKELARASHSEIQRGNNAYAFGMSLVQIGIILITIGCIFFILALKPTEFTLVNKYTESLASRYGFYVGFRTSFIVSIVAFALTGIIAIINHYIKVKYPKIQKMLIWIFSIVGILGICAAFVMFVLAHNPNTIQIKDPQTGEIIIQQITFAFVFKHVEFWIFVVCSIIALGLLGGGLALVIIGILRKAKYNRLLEDINNKTFVQ